MIARRTLAAFGTLLLLGCEANTGSNQAETIYRVSPEDAEMNAAKARAIATLPEFYAHFAHPQADETEFLIKFDILPGEDAEFVWAGDLDRTVVPVTGVLINQPERGPHRIGQRVPIPEADIIDWTYRKGRVMQGGLTNRVTLAHLPPDEAASFRNYLGW
jgi:uncharacterized protein YegJ (DUF2314 family)